MVSGGHMDPGSLSDGVWWSHGSDSVHIVDPQVLVSVLVFHAPIGCLHKKRMMIKYCTYKDEEIQHPRWFAFKDSDITSGSVLCQSELT